MIYISLMFNQHLNHLRWSWKPLGLMEVWGWVPSSPLVKFPRKNESDENIWEIWEVELWWLEFSNSECIITHPQTNECPLEKGPFQKRKARLLASFFRGRCLSLWVYPHHFFLLEINDFFERHGSFKNDVTENKIGLKCWPKLTIAKWYPVFVRTASMLWWFFQYWPICCDFSFNGSPQFISIYHRLPTLCEDRQRVGNSAVGIFSFGIWSSPAIPTWKPIFSSWLSQPLQQSMPV